MTSTILASFSSPDRGVWHLGIIPIRAYALCIIAGIIAALIIGDRRWAARGGQRGVIYDIALWAVPFGLIGGRLYHVMTDWPTYFGPDGLGFLAALRIWDGGLGIWGAVALGGVGAWIGCRQLGIPLPAFGDAIAPGIVLAQAIGRLGNYFNQELYGGPTDLPWGLKIYQRVTADGRLDMLNGVSTGQLYEPTPVHPTFLYELLWNVLVFAVLLWADRRFRLGHGRLFALYVALYCVGRFGVELLRHDHASLIAGIRVNSFTSSFVLIGAVIYIWAAKRGREEPETLWGKSRDDEDESAKVPLAAGAAAAGVAGVAAASASEPEAGLGSVEGDDVAAAGDDAAEVHEAAVENAVEADATADEVAEKPEPTELAAEAEPVEPEPTDTPVNEAGLGSVEGDEVAAAEEDAAVVHDAAVEDTAEAEATADDVADEGSDNEGSDNEAGLGSVEGDDVAAAEDDAAEVHAAAVEQANDAEETAAKVADEPTPARRRWWRRNR